MWSEFFNKDRSLNVKECTVCFFRFQTIADGECAYEALQSERAVFCDLSGREQSEIRRFKDYLQGVCISIDASIKELCEDYIVYFPKIYHLQVFEN